MNSSRYNELKRLLVDPLWEVVFGTVVAGVGIAVWWVLTQVLGGVAILLEIVYVSCTPLFLRTPLPRAVSIGFLLATGLALLLSIVKFVPG